MPVNPAPTTVTARIRVELVQAVAQPLRVLQFCDGMGEFGRAGH